MIYVWTRTSDRHHNGGDGSRMGAAVPKQFLKIKGQTVLEKSGAASFENNGFVDDILVVCGQDSVPLCKKIMFCIFKGQGHHNRRRAEAGFGAQRHQCP